MAIALLPTGVSAYANPDVTVNQLAGQDDPVVTSTAGLASVTVNFTAVFSEPVNGFDASDVTVTGTSTGGTVGTVTGGPMEFTIPISGFTGPGTVIASIAAGKCTDQFDTDSNNASTSTDNTVTINLDTSAPTATINQAATQLDPTDDCVVDFTVVWSEPVLGFLASMITLVAPAGASVTQFSTTDNTTWHVGVSGMTAGGTITATIPINAGITDIVGNANAAPATFTDNVVTYQYLVPSVTVVQEVGQADPTSESPIHFTVTFSQTVTGFGDAPTDVTIIGGDGSALATTSEIIDTGDQKVYDVLISGMTRSGDVAIIIPAGVANHNCVNNTASVIPNPTDNSVWFECTAPTVTVTKAAGQNDPTDVTPVNFTVVFSSPVTGFTGDDLLDPTGTANPKDATITGSGTTYNVAVSGMKGNGSVCLSIPPGVAFDAVSGCPNAASEGQACVVFTGCCCMPVAPDFSVPLGTVINEQLFIDNGASCTGEGCEMYIGYCLINHVGEATGEYKVLPGAPIPPGCYDYMVDCDNGKCDTEVYGTITVEDRVCVEIIECPSIDGQLVKPGIEFVVKAKVTNNNLCELDDVSATVVFDPAMVKLLSPSEAEPSATINLHDMEAGELDTVAWTFRCIAPGDTEIEVYAEDNNCEFCLLGGDPGCNPYPCNRDSCSVHQRTGPGLLVSLSSPCETCVACANNTYTVTATVSNNGDTPVSGISATISKLSGANVTIATPYTKDLGTLNKNDSTTVSWNVTPAAGSGAIGNVTFQVSVSGTNSWTSDPVGPITATSITHQTEIMVDVICVQPMDPVDWDLGTWGAVACQSVCPTNSAGRPSAVVSGDPSEPGVYDQQFQITTKISNCSNTDKPMRVYLTIPKNARVIGTTAYWEKFNSVGVRTDFGNISTTITSVSTFDTNGEAYVKVPGKLCACCFLTVRWTLACNGASNGYPNAELIKVKAVQFTLENGNGDPAPGYNPWYNEPCHHAYILQEDKAHLTTSLQGVVADCADGVYDSPVNTVEIGQTFDAIITFTNTGDATAVGVTYTVTISGGTDKVGTFTSLPLGDIPGNESINVNLSDIVDGVLTCIDSTEVLIQVDQVTGMDENTCEEIPAPNRPQPCQLAVTQCGFEVELINPVDGEYICVGNPFAVKARLTNYGTCTLEDIEVTLMWEGCGAVTLGPDELITHRIDLIAPDPSGLEVVFETSWMVKCKCPGDIKFFVCVKTNVDGLEGLRTMQVKSNEATVTQCVPPEISIDIVSPDNFTTIGATSQEFAVTAVITNDIYESELTITDLGLNITPGSATIISEPDSGFVIPIGGQTTVTWTVSASVEGLYTIEAWATAATCEVCPPDTANTYPLIVWQYPVAHLDAEILSVTPSDIQSGSDFEVAYRVTNTGNADATEVVVTLSAFPYASVLPAAGENGFTQFVGTIPAHGSLVNYYDGTFALTSAGAGNAVLTINANGDDEYGWHKKQVCQSTGHFTVGTGEIWNFPAYYTGDIHQFGVLVGDASGLIGPFNLDPPVSYTDLMMGATVTGQFVGSGVVVPAGSMNRDVYYEILHYFGMEMLGGGLPEDLMATKDVMIYAGQIIGSQPEPMWPWFMNWLDDAMINVVNGTISGAGMMESSFGGPPMMEEGIYSWMNGQYCSTLAMESFRAIDPKFIEPASVTIKQTEPAQPVDLAVTKTVDNDRPLAGGTVNFTVTVTNNGPGAATGVEVSDVLDANLTYVSSSASMGSYDSGVWTVGDLGEGTSATLTIKATVVTAAQTTNTACVSALDQTDWNSFNDSASVTLNVAATTAVPVALSAGWNLISLPLIPANTSTNTILTGLDWTSIYYWNGTTWVSLNHTPNVGTLTTMGDGKGYYLLINSAGTLNVGGVEIAAPPALPPSYTVTNGWNMIGFKSVTAMKASAYLAAIEGKYTIMYRMVNGVFSAVRSSDNMRPGEGYWIAIIGGGGTIYP